MPEQLLALPLKGLATTPDPLMIAEGKSPDLQNVRFRHSRIDKRPGYSRFDQAAGVGLAYGRNFIQASFSGTDTVGGVTEQFLMLRGDTIYEWDVVASTWIPHVLPTQDVHTMSAAERFGVANTLDAVFATAWDARLRQWDGDLYTYVAHDLGFNFSALTVIAFANRLVMVRTREGTTTHPVRIRWCANGQVTKWDPAVTDGAGVLDVVESNEKALSGAFVINGRAFLTREQELLELIATGGLDPVFRVEPRVSGIGMIAPHSWAAGDGFGFFLGHNDVYAFDGSQPRGVGGDVIEEILQSIAYTNILNGTAQLVYGRHFARNGEYWLFAAGGPDAPAAAVSRVWIYDYMADRWYRDQLPYPVGAFGAFYPTEVPGLAVSPGQRMPTMVLSADPSGGPVADSGTFFLDTTRPATDVSAQTGEGMPFDAFVTCKDQYALAVRNGQGVPKLNQRNTVACVTYQAVPGTRVFVGVSADRGASWTEKEIVTRPEGLGYAWFHQPFAQLRIRLRNRNDQPMHLRGAVSYQWKQAGVVLSSG